MIKLTKITAYLNKEAEERLDNFQKYEPGAKVDAHGHSAEWYEDMGLAVPEDLQDTSDVNEIRFTPDDYEFFTSVFYLDAEIESIEQEENSSIITLKNGREIAVAERATKVHKLYTEYKQLIK